MSQSVKDQGCPKGNRATDLGPFKKRSSYWDRCRALLNGALVGIQVFVIRLVSWEQLERGMSVKDARGRSPAEDPPAQKTIKT